MDDSTVPSFQLSPMDCQMPRRHVTKLLFFPSSDVQPVSIAESLRKGLKLTTQLVPALSGTVKVSHLGPQSGRLIVSEPHRTVEEMFAVNDLRAHRGYDYDRMRERQFPTYDWGESVKLEFYAFLSRSQEADQPVFTAKVTLIKGGLVFAISSHHCFTDGNGVAKVMEIWSSYCRGEHPTLAADSLSRSRLMGEPGVATIEAFPGLKYVNDSETEPGSFAQLHDFLQQKTRNWFNVLKKLFMQAWYQLGQKKASPDAKSMTCILFFSNDKLKELKLLASNGKQHENDGSWISTQDSLSALLWCSFVDARQERDPVPCLNSPTPSKVEAFQPPPPPSKDPPRDHTTVGMGILLNARHLLQPPLPPSFIGNALLLTGIQHPLAQVTTTAEAISTIASSLRASINAKTPAYLRRYLSALASVDDIRKVARSTRGLNPRYTLVLSSWRGQDYYNQGWGQVFGSECERVRAAVGPLPSGLAIVLPEIKGAACASSAAGLEVAIGLSEEDVPRLKENELLNRFCEWR